MKNPGSKSVSRPALALMVAVAFAVGCNGGNNVIEASSGQISDPPTVNPAFGARHARKCGSVTHVPTPAEAGALAQCKKEVESREMMLLWQNLSVQMSKPRAYIYDQDSHSNNIDTTARVYPIRVTGDKYACIGGKTCPATHTTNAEGTCYKTTFGDWHCYFQEDATDMNSTPKPVPTTY